MTTIYWHQHCETDLRHGSPYGCALALEQDLVRRAVEDPGAFGPLYRRHYPVIAGYLLRRLGHRDAAEDVAAETFLVALQKLGQFERRGGRLLPWLYGIATNKANRSLRDDARRARRERFRARPDVAEDSPKLTPIGDALRTLPTKHQSVLVLHYVEGLSVAQVAEALGLSEGTVKSRLSRGRAGLRQLLNINEYTTKEAGYEHA